jgi:predicted RNase H-like HicB family nuclease
MDPNPCGFGPLNSVRLVPAAARDPVMEGARMMTGGNRMKFKVALKQSEEGFSVSVPGLPGCWSQGRTEAEALASIEDAIRVYLEVAQELAEQGEVREIEVAV